MTVLTERAPIDETTDRDSDLRHISDRLKPPHVKTLCGLMIVEGDARWECIPREQDADDCVVCLAEEERLNWGPA